MTSPTGGGSSGDVTIATLWVPVVPETSQVGPKMEEAGKEAKGRFRESVRDIGSTIHDDLEKVGSRAKDIFTSAGHSIHDALSRASVDSSKTISDNLAKAGEDGARAITNRFGVLGTLLEGQASDIGAKVGTNLGNTLTQHFAAAEGPIGAIGDRVGSIIGDKIGGALGRVDDLAKRIGIDLGEGGVAGAVQDVFNKSANVRGQIEQWSELFKGLPGIIGRVGTAISELAGPISVGIGLGKELANLFDHVGAIHDRFMNPDGTPKSGIDRWIMEHGGPLKFFEPPSMHAPAPPAPAPTPGALPATAPGGPLDPTRLGGAPGGGGAPPPMPAPPASQSTPTTDIPSGSNVYWGAAAAAPPAPTSGTDWDAIAQAESGGRWDLGSDSQGRAFRGGLQILDSTWVQFGGTAYAPTADKATREQQIAVAERILAHQGPKAWPNTYHFGAPGGAGAAAAASGAGGGGSAPAPRAPRSMTSSVTSLPDVRGAHPQLAYALAAAQSMFPDLQLTAGMSDHPMDQGWHPKGQAIDIGGGTPAEQAALSNYLLQFAPYIEELIHSGPGVTQNIKSGKLGPAIDMPGSVYSSGQAGYHGDHVHLAVTDAQAAAFEAALTGGRGRAGAAGGQIPTGAQHDPVYVASSDKDKTADDQKSPFEKEANDLGKGLVNGLLEAVGLDGSVLSGFPGQNLGSPLQWGITKLGTGILKYVAGIGASDGAGSVAGGDGSTLPFLDLIPGLKNVIPGAAGSNVVPTAHQGTGAAPGPTTNIGNIDHSLNVTQNVKDNTPLFDIQGMANSANRYQGFMPSQVNGGT